MENEKEPLATKSSVTNTLFLTDLYLCAVLKIHGYEPVSVARGSDGIAVFIYKGPGDELNKIQRDYFEGKIRVDPRAFASAWKQLRRKLDHI